MLTRRGLFHLALAGDDSPDGSLLVVVFLRGGADGLSLCPPLFEESYYELRPTLAVDAADAIALDGRFGLHPQLRALAPLWERGEMNVVHAVGSDDETRSHFEAQDRMEHAGLRRGSIGSGWIARLLRAKRSSESGPATALQAVSIGERRPESVRGAQAVAVLRSVSDYRLGPKRDPDFETALADLYRGKGPLLAAGRGALQTVAEVADLTEAKAPQGDAFARGLSEIAGLVEAGQPVDVATIDLGNWDTHFVQSSILATNARSLAEGIAAFAEELGDAWSRTSVVVMTEFGRRAYENTSMGTDHGRGGAMFIFGGGVDGGRVVTDWPGLRESELEAPGDLRVTIDYRDVIAEVLHKRHRARALGDVFPGHRSRFRGVC